jgi:small-conductance mechanosensitive channel
MSIAIHALSPRVVRSLLLVGLWLALPVAVRGEDPAAKADLHENGAVVEVVPVVIDGETLFSLRGITAYPAGRRAAEVTSRIREVARDPRFDPATLSLAEVARATLVMAGETRVLAVFEADAELEAVDRLTLAEVYVSEIRQAILDYRRARTREALLDSTGGAATATAVAALLFFLVVRSVRSVHRWIERHYRERIQSLKIKSFEVVRAERLWGVVDTALRLFRAGALLLIVYLWARTLFTLFPWTRGIGHQLDDWLLAPLALLGRGFVEKLPDLIFLAVLYFLTRWLLRLLHLFFSAVGRGELAFEGFDPDWAEPTYKLVRVAAVAFALVVAYPYIPGSSSAAFKGVSLFLGVVFSLGSSSSISNVIAGYTMTYRRAFREGDRVKIAGIVGDVSNVRLQVTHLRTPKNEEVVVPNSQILASEVVNFSTLAKKHGLILHTTVGIGYETPWRQVEAMLLEAARRTPGLLAEPAPFVFQTALGDFCITYEINVYCDDPRRMGPLYSALHANILDVFNEHGVQIMTPAYEGDPEQPKIVPRDQWHLPPAAQP